jgi:hypothetical protein
MAVAIRPLGQAAAAAWDAFVEAHPDGTFFHRAAWATIIEQAFGHRTLYVYAERDGAITGVLPLAQVKTLLFGNALISVPFCVYGGPPGYRVRLVRARRFVAGTHRRQRGRVPLSQAGGQDEWRRDEWQRRRRNTGHGHNARRVGTYANTVMAGHRAGHDVETRRHPGDDDGWYSWRSRIGRCCRSVSPSAA